MLCPNDLSFCKGEESSNWNLWAAHMDRQGPICGTVRLALLYAQMLTLSFEIQKKHQL